jgi:hypothetical protein
MDRKLAIILGLALLPAIAAGAPDQVPQPTEPKELSGMSIVGNDEAPKSLYIVPWKSSELGGETNLNLVFDARDVPVDRDVFMRQLDFYQVSMAESAGDSAPETNQLR